MNRPPAFQSRRRGFLLIEVMLAVVIFSLAVLALGKSVEALINAQTIRNEDAKVRRFLEGKMAEVEAGAVPLQDSKVEEVKGWMPDMKLKTTRKLLQKRKNEKDQEITGIYLVTLETTWVIDSQEQSRSLQFYIYPRQR